MSNGLKNIDQFHKCVAVNYDDEIKSWDMPGNDSGRNPIKTEIQVYMNSIFFLRDEAYIRSDDPAHGQDQRIFRGCKLTSKGLAALGRIGVKEKINWGGLLHTAVKEGKYKALQDLATKVLSSGLG